MLLKINRSLLSQAVAIHIAKKYKINSNLIRDISFNEESLISGVFTDKPFGENQSRPLLEIKCSINDIPVIETISNETYLFNVAKTLISSELGLNDSDFIIEEITSDRENNNLVTVNFYINEDEE